MRPGPCAAEPQLAADGGADEQWRIIAGGATGLSRSTVAAITEAQQRLLIGGVEENPPREQASPLV